MVEEEGGGVVVVRVSVTWEREFIGCRVFSAKELCSTKKKTTTKTEGKLNDRSLNDSPNDRSS